MKRNTFLRVFSVATAGAIVAASPLLATAATTPAKTAVKFNLDQLGKASAITASNNNPVQFVPYTTPLVGVTAQSLTPDICTVTYPMELTNVAVFTPKPGLCRFRVSVANTAKYTGSVDYSFTIPKLKQNMFKPLVTAPDEIPSTFKEGDNVYAHLTPIWTPMVPIGKTWDAAFGTPYQLISSDPSVCTATSRIDDRNDMLIIYPWAVSSGDCTITILRPASDLFEEFRLDWPLKVIMKSAPAAKSNQDIVFPVISAPSVGQNVTLSATGGSSGNAVTFSSKTPAVCTVEGTVLSALTEGECIVTADQAGNDKFNAAPQKTQTVTIVAAALAKTPQTITLGTAPEPISVGANVTLSATGGDSGNALTFASQTPEICTVEGSVLTAKAVGSCVVEVNQKGNDQYGDAPAQLLTVTIKEAVAAVAAKTEQTITFAPLSPVAVGSTATLAAIGGDSGNPLRFSALTPDTCTVNGTTLTAVAEGKCSVAADQDGNDTFSPATQKTLDVSIVKEITTFSVTVNVLGELTAQTIIAKINPASSEAGKNGSEFLAAQLGDMTFLYGAGGWVQYSGADSVVALSSGALASHELTLLDNVDMTPLLGAQIFVGYGLGDSLAEAYSEMQKASRMMSVYKVE